MPTPPSAAHRGPQPSPPSTAEARSIALGPQGGDARQRRLSVLVDVSTCVSPHGPPPAALEAVRSLPADVLARHPYAAADDLRTAYAEYLEVADGELVVARGASEFVWQLAASAAASRVVVPLPAYTEYCQAFPGAADPAEPHGGDAGEMHHSLAAMDDALSAGRTVLLSNPHNPSGRAFSAAALADLARARPQGTLIVDESYVEFCADPAHWSLIGVDAGNVAVVRSPSKFFGLAGARVGVAWSRSPAIRALLTPMRGSWPVSAIEVAPVAAALADRGWATRNRATTLADTTWLVALLDRVGASLGRVVGGSVTHYRLLATEAAAALSEALAVAGVGVRLLGPAHGLPLPAVRVTAPAEPDRPIVAAAFEAVSASWGAEVGHGLGPPRAPAAGAVAGMLPSAAAPGALSAQPRRPPIVSR